MAVNFGGKLRQRALLVLLILLTLTLFRSAGFSQSIDPPYEVATWQGFRAAAVSFTFDDGTPNQSSVAIPMFNQYGFKATFFTVINWGPNWTALQAAANNGHEIASHTMSHASLNSTTTDQYAELKNSQDAINARIAGQKCLTIAYPNCLIGDKTLCSQFYIAARICSGQIESSTPSDFMAISSFVCGTQGSIQRSEDFSNKVASAVRTKGWMIFLIHAIDSESGYSPTSSTQLRGALDSLKAHQEIYWVSSFVNIVRYIRERNSVSLKELSASDSTIVVRVTDTLPDSVYNYAVTIRRPLPVNWSSASLTQNGKALDAQIVAVSGIPYVMFDVVPDEGDVLLRKSTATSVGSLFNTVPSRTTLMQNYPNPFNPSTVIRYSLNRAGDVSLRVYDMFGRELEALAQGYQAAGEYQVTWQSGALPSGIYFCRLRTGSSTETKRLALVR
jgi:hypothetical protein